MNLGPAELSLIVLVCGTLAGSIALSRFHTARSFAGFFIIGALLPVLGILAAYLIKRHVPQRAGAARI